MWKSNTTNFQSVSRQTQIDIPTNSTDLITQTSKRLFHELWNQQPVRLLGIRTTKLVDENEPVQLSLFDLDFPIFLQTKQMPMPIFRKKPSPEKQKKSWMQHLILFAKKLWKKKR